MTENPKIRLGILGASGRMGSELRTLLAQTEFSNRLELVATPAQGKSFESLFGAEVIVDFSSPSGTLAYARTATQHRIGIPLLVGTTGWSPHELTELGELAGRFPILRSANFSLGIRLCRLALEIWRDTSEFENWRVSIRESHHTDKKDAPSGTALALRDLLGRNAPIESFRGGDLIGIHEIVLETEREKIRLIHEAKSRAGFAEGALAAAIRLAQAPRDSLPKRLLGLDDLYLRSDA